MDLLVGHFDMQRRSVSIGVDRNGLDAQPAGRLDDATGNLAPVRDQDFIEHSSSQLNSHSELGSARKHERFPPKLLDFGDKKALKN
jgi:hypothetical protein